MEYKLVAMNFQVFNGIETIKKFEHEINGLLKDSWEILGCTEIKIIFDSSYGILYQTLIKKTKN